MQSQAIRPSSHTTRNLSAPKGKQGSLRTRRSDDTSGPLPSLLNRSENMIEKKGKCSDSSIDEAHLILSKHMDLGYVPFQTAGNQIQKDAQTQFARARENYQLPHPVGVVLTYATLSKYYPDATAGKVLQVWKQAVEDWQTLGDMTRELYRSDNYEKIAHFYGRDGKSFDKEKNRASLIQSYLQREENMRSEAKRKGKKPMGVFDRTAFEDLTFQEAATNDILLNTMFLANSDKDKEERFQRECDNKHIRKEQEKRSQDEFDEMDLYIAQLEAANGQNRYKDGRKDPSKQDPMKALAHSGAMLLTRGMQKAAKSALKTLKPM